jgi:multicomponent Na+:H+ antiporter subunit A
VIALLVLSPFVFSPVAALVGARWPKHVWWLAAWPAGLAVVFEHILRTRVAVDGPLIVSLPWAPSLGLTLQFNLDGLGLLFALMITVIGALIVLYASAYMQGHARIGRLLATLFVFMGAMLGVVLSDNLFVLFVFWELTGFSSFLLIGFEHDKATARASAMQSLLVTGAGGIALLAGAALLAQITGATTISDVLVGGTHVTGHPFYLACTTLFLLAAFTKSAQVPFHFWLPNAMAAPTPVSAYLHSATMVKAGVYLLARMTPILGGTTFWSTALMVIGGVTMVGAAWRSVQETDLKRILAFSTASALGSLVLMIGIGTPGAFVAAVVYMIAHAAYKGTLFMVAGAIDHEVGTRDVTRLSGLRALMPKTATAGALAAASMMGLPLFFGFFGKELFYEAGWQYGGSAGLLLAVAVGANALSGVAGLLAGVGPFVGPRMTGADHVHEPPWPMWFGPMCLAVTGIVFTLVPGLVNGPIALATASMTGAVAPLRLALWHGFTPVLGLSVLTLALAAGLYTQRALLRRAVPGSLGSEGIYHVILRLLDASSAAVAPALQSGSLRSYVLVLILATGGLLGGALFVGGGGWSIAQLTAFRAHEVLIAMLICAGAVMAARSTSSMKAVIALGAVGYGVALLFVMYGAPDLAMTQFSVETLTVVIFVLVFRMFGSFAHLSSRFVRTRDALIAGVVGAGVSTLVLLVGAGDRMSRLKDFFVETGPTLGHGRNIVNVILVDFRGFDTLGEITVLVVAAIGVHALLRISADERGRP